ncbi:MAG: TerC/Alx family metal homeostasis membrane protein [Alphaproteobacteria bacterium]|nr:TerC/Alx family metal homeostasis membrane protein [Alphaproteobacteria bacterium]
MTSFWIGFNVIILLLLALDLGIFRRKNPAPSQKQALLWTGIWVCLAVLFGFCIFWFQGYEQGLAFFTSYVIEKTLSLDNLMVFCFIFSAFNVPPHYQHHVLCWGIIGALIMRGAMIWGGIVLLQKFHFLMFVFGVVLILFGIKAFLSPKEGNCIEKTKMWKLIHKYTFMTDHLHGKRFWAYDKKTNKRRMTPLFASLLLVEFSDLIFAVDSIGAILAITQDPFIVYTSNVFAILGLRSMYFFLGNSMEKIPNLNKGLGLVLCFVGCKMANVIEIGMLYSFIIIVSIILLSMFAPIKGTKTI